MTDDLPDQFFVELTRVCQSLGCDPADLLAVIASESQVRPDAQHKSSRATGLIQFMPKTLQGLGWTDGPDAFRRLPAVAQLTYVQKYFQPFVRHGLGSSGRLYQATFLPGTLARGADPATVVCAKDGPFADAYAANAGLDADGDGAITVAELTARTDRVRQGAHWESLMARLNAACATTA